MFSKYQIKQLSKEYKIPAYKINKLIKLLLEDISKKILDGEKVTLHKLVTFELVKQNIKINNLTKKTMPKQYKLKTNVSRAFNKKIKAKKIG